MKILFIALRISEIFFVLLAISYIENYIRFVRKKGELKNLFFSCSTVVYKGGKQSMQTLVATMLVFSFVIGGVFFVMDTFLRQKTIGSIIEKSDYTAKYYVEMYDDETERLIGTYPADIECSTYEEDYNDQTYSYREYRVDTIYTPKGEIWCDMDGVSLDDIEDGYKASVYDSDIGSFDVRITKSKVQ